MVRAAVALSIIVADAFVFLLVSLTCGIGENLEGGHARLCNHNHPQARIYLPLLGIVIVLTGFYAARRLDRGWIFPLSATIALAAAVYIWGVASS